MSTFAAKRPQRRKQPRRQGRRQKRGLSELFARAGSENSKRRAGARRAGAGNRKRQAGNRRIQQADKTAKTQPAPNRLAPLAKRAGSLLARLALAGGLAWGLLIGAQQGYAYVTTSPRFAAQHLLFAPTEHISPERVASLMGIDEGTNLLALDTEDLEQRIAEDRWVESVEVRRELPDTLRVSIVEHEAAAVLLADRFYLVDPTGRPFKRLDRGERGDLPIITGVSRELLDEREAWARAMIHRALEVQRTYVADAGRPTLGEVHVGETGELTIYTAAERTELRLGRDDYAAKLARYDALRAALGDKAERLAVVHLDAIGGGDRSERIVASFLSPADEEAVLGRGSAAHSGDGATRDRTKESDADAAKKKGAAEGAAAAVTPPPHAPPSRNKTRRIPRYE
ncbi:MAG: FtsQ-type POTRA domain-containing protein [Myxococcales bacterium]|nr:FtsQ-type POTRA domain-containing protein [Myxococcales bacterium]